MKKRLAFVVAIIMTALCFTACNDSSTEGATSSKTEPSSVKSVESSSEAQKEETQTQPSQSEEQTKETQNTQPIDLKDIKSLIVGVWVDNSDESYTQFKDDGKVVLDFTLQNRSSYLDLYYDAEGEILSFYISEDKSNATATYEVSVVDANNIKVKNMDTSKESNLARTEMSAVEEKQNRQKAANEKAKEIANIINNKASDLIADGKSAEYKTNGTVKISSFADSSNVFEKELYIALKKDKIEDGYININELFDGEETSYVQWSSAESGADVGQYPAPDNTAETIVFGKRSRAKDDPKKDS